MRLERSPVQTDARIVAVDSCGDNVVLVGTDQGELAIAGAQEPLARTKNGTKVLSILAISEHSALVFSERSNGSIGSATAYKVPALEPISGFTLHDVGGGVLLGRRVAVFSSGAIRILRFSADTSQKPSLERSIELKGVTKGCRSELDSSIMLVATTTEYQLIDVSTSARIPLFPIHPNMEPLMAGFGADFLVVQGTGESEPAMGLLVDSQGEVARSGVVIQWDSYPRSIATAGDYILAVARDNGGLVVHHVDPVDNAVREIVDIKDRTVKEVFRLTFSHHVVDKRLLELLGDEALSRQNASIAILYEDGEIELWGAPSRLFDLINKVSDGSLTEIVPDPNTAGSAQGFAELEYLSLLLVFHNLDQGNYGRATRAWLEGTQIPYETVLYIYGDDKVAEPKIYPGLLPLLSSLRQKGRSGQLDDSFLKSFLKTEIKRHRRNPSTAYTSAKVLEMRYAKMLNRDELARLLLERDLKARKEILGWLEKTHSYDTLEHYYSFSDRQGALAKLRLRIARDPQSSDNEVQRAALGLVDFALRVPDRSPDTIDIWDLTMELVGNTRIDPSISLDLLTHPQFESIFEPKEILQTLKERTDSGEPWRIYLKHLVYSRGIYTDDLASILIADMIDFVNANRECLEEIEATYERFRQTPWPKPLYRTFLSHWVADDQKKYPRELLNLQEEFWRLLDRQSESGDFSSLLELPSIMSTFEARLPFLYLERATIYRNLGLHGQAVELLCDQMTDYRAVIDYEDAVATNNDLDTKRDIAKLAVKKLLAVTGPQKNPVLRDFINERGTLLDFNSFLDQLTDDTPFSVLADYAIENVKHRDSLEHRARFLLALAKADTSRYRSLAENSS